VFLSNNATIFLPPSHKYACDDELINHLFHISHLWMDKTNHNHSSGSPLQKLEIPLGFSTYILLQQLNEMNLAFFSKEKGKIVICADAINLV